MVDFPISIYKYCSHDIATLMEEGKFKIGTMADYRQFEIRNDAIGDGLEDTRVSHTPFFSSEQATPEQIARLPEIGISARGGSKVTVVNHRYVERATNSHIFSFAETASLEDLHRWNERTAGEKTPYDTCLEIKGFVSFKQRLVDALKQKLQGQNGMGDLYVAARSVTYDWEESHYLLHTSPPEPGPFRKRSSYAWQNEGRIVFRFPGLQVVEPEIVMIDDCPEIVRCYSL